MACEFQMLTQNACASSLVAVSADALHHATITEKLFMRLNGTVSWNRDLS